MDLDALGLNSTFESTELQGGYEPAVDRVDTSEIEGPEDFTMNMTYWMTADLPLAQAQIKSRKEAKGRVQQARMDATEEEEVVHELTVGGDQAAVEASSRERKDAKSTQASPTRRVNGTTDERAYSTPASERSMENEEKVRSFLSALPDTDMESAIAGTPLHLPRHSFLQIPRPSPPKARSLQPTVEDYDTPRKPTQETVIHHVTAVMDTVKDDALRQQVKELQSRLFHQDMASQKRITELETMLSYSRSELDNARDNWWTQKDTSAKLEGKLMRQTGEFEAKLRAREEALETKMHEYGKEMRLQTQAKFQKQHDDYELSLAAADAKRLVEEETRGKEAEVLAELNLAKQQLEAVRETDVDTATGNHAELTLQLSAVQARADHLQAQLKHVTAEAVCSQNSLRMDVRHRTCQVANLETSLQAARFELECAQADVAAKGQLFRTNMELNAHIRTLRLDLETARSRVAMEDLHVSRDVELMGRIESLQSQLNTSRTETLSKEHIISGHINTQEQLEQQLNTVQGRVEGLEATIITLRQQLAEAHRDNARARADSEEFERDLEDARDRLKDARAEADRRMLDLGQRLSKSKESKLETDRNFNDLQSERDELVEQYESRLEEAHAEAQRHIQNVEQKLHKVKDSKSETERKFRELQSQRDDLVEGHEAMLEDAHNKAEEAVRKAGVLLDQERTEKKRVAKDLKRIKDDFEKLRIETAQKLVEDAGLSEEDMDASSLSTTSKVKDTEITKLREIIRKQVSEMKTLKTENSTLRRESKKLKTTMESHSDLESTISNLQDQLNTLHAEKTTLQSSLEEQGVVNMAMDERLAKLLSKVMKERTKSVVGKRDGQWQESVGQVQVEKELMGKMLLRQWGREEVGIVDEKVGEKQVYKYQYVKRERV
jgi:hypothetical protein